jgi:hypothetical protein
MKAKWLIYSNRIHAKHNFFPALITGLIDDDLSQVDTQENIIPLTLLYVHLLHTNPQI